ncbi:MAG TPA: alpha/beta hydrolase [Candidatus Binatia bacterium]|jgi:pimeloyl-ACP methyl ester carboxylesterase
MAAHATSPPVDASWRHDDVVAGPVRLHVVRAGHGRPVVLLHGFPEFWYSWRYQMAALAEAGFEAVAPDMRGYNTSEKPRGIRAYDIDSLVADIVTLVDQLCGGRAMLVGHDWGGIVAWYAAMRHPESFDKLVILNAPHPAAYRRDLFTRRQWLHSLYVLFFQIPWLPELLLTARHARAVGEMFRREVRSSDAFARGEAMRYREAFVRPGAATSALNYYRAMFRRGRRFGQADVPSIRIPTLLLWGDRDPYLLPSLAEGLEEWIPDLAVRHFPVAGHWLQLEEPDAVSRAIVDFLAGEDAPT